MIDRDKILALVGRHFTGGSGLSSITIDEQGLVDANENLSLKQSCRQIGKLPVRFGKIDGNLWLDYSDISTLEGCPRILTGTLGLESCGLLTNLSGGPYDCYEIMAENTRLHSLVGLPKHCENIQVSVSPTMGLLSLLLVKGLTSVYLTDDWGIGSEMPQSSIINRYLSKGRDGIIPCAAELHKAGFGGNAKL
jgi:hypothetical protein